MFSNISTDTSKGGSPLASIPEEKHTISELEQFVNIFENFYVKNILWSNILRIINLLWFLIFTSGEVWLGFFYASLRYHLKCFSDEY